MKASSISWKLERTMMFLSWHFLILKGQTLVLVAGVGAEELAHGVQRPQDSQGPSAGQEIN